MGSMPYSLVSEALDLTQMVMDIQKQLKLTYHTQQCFFNNITKKSFPGRPRGQCPTPGCPRLWTSPRWSCTSGNNWIDLFYHTQQNVFQQCNQKLFPGDTLGSMSYTWVSEGLDLTQIVMDIQKQLKTTIIIIPNNICFNNITKKSFPVTPQVQCPTPWSRRLWTSPRWSWMFCTYIFQISGLRAFIWHLNLEPTVKTSGNQSFSFFTLLKL